MEPLTIRQYLTKNLDKYENRAELIDECVKKLGVTPGAVKDKLRIVLRSQNGGILPSSKSSSLKTAINAEEFRKQQDPTIKVKKALKGLGKNVIWDTDFRAEMHIQSNKWKRIANKIDPNETHRLKVKGKTLWGQPDVLKKIEETIDII
jgi:hypothetical protein